MAVRMELDGRYKMMGIPEQRETDGALQGQIYIADLLALPLASINMLACGQTSPKPKVV